MKTYVREGMRIIDVCEKAEDLIRKKGAKPAFPCNVSINEIAAHYTSPPNDEKTIPEKALAKVDIGAHVDGYVTDTAVSVCFDPEFSGMVETAEHALRTAVENIKPGISTSKLGATIEKTIKNRGFKPISNLCGHQVGRYIIHTGTSIPNVSQISFSKLNVGGVYAIEPFVTVPDAAGRVVDEDQATIFRFLKTKSLKSPYAKQLLKHIEQEFKTLPFAQRWLQNLVPKEYFQEAFRELLSSKTIMQYPVFVEASRKIVAQAEHTVLVTEESCTVLT